MAIENLAAINDINRVVHMLNSDYDISPEKFYDKMLLDTIKLGSEHYVHLKNTESHTLQKGTKSLQKRRWGGLTAHTTPLKEGIPPRPDKTSMESVTFTATQFGRWMEFTDRVTLDQIDPIIAHYTKELGDVMVRTLERYARETMLSAASRLYAGNRTSVGELQVGDRITMADLRFMVLRMQRLLVKPMSDGFFHYICSPEELHDMIDDEVVQKYMEINNTTRQLYEDGQPFPLFQIKFVPTMLDEFYTPDLDNPGEYFDGTEYKLRTYAVDDSGVAYYRNISESGNKTVEEEAYLSDGTAITDLEKWTIPTPTSDDVLEKEKADGTIVESTVGGSGDDDISVEDAEALNFQQLPVHSGILYGKDGLIKLSIAGEDNVKTFVKPLGSAGTNDPLNQRQTLGAKINSIGYGILRDEAIVVTKSVPSTAIYTSGLTADVRDVAKTTSDSTDNEDDTLDHRDYTVPEDKDVTINKLDTPE